MLKGLTEEQITKAKARKNQEEILKLAKEEDIELSDEQLEVVSFGGGTENAQNAIAQTSISSATQLDGNLLANHTDTLGLYDIATDKTRKTDIQRSFSIRGFLKGVKWPANVTE